MSLNYKRKKRLLCISLAAVLALCAGGCGQSSDGAFHSIGPASPVRFAAGSVEPDTAELTITLEEGETELLSQLPELKSADFSGSSCVDEIFRWAQAHPETEVRYTVPMPDGSIVPHDTGSVDLSAKSGSEIAEMLPYLKYLPALRTIELGQERSGLGWDTVSALEQSFPDAKLKYTFWLYGIETELNNTQINLSHIFLHDGGAAVAEAMDYMPKLCYVDMDSCGVSDEVMAAIRDAHPSVKVVWRVWFGTNYSVRTDVERILASSPSHGGMLTPENAQSLKYCTDVKYLDIGHNDDLTDISFVAYMPKLEVAILAMDFWSDASPLANCPELEYLEIQTTACTDISPLSGLTKLRHLNIAYNTNLVDISPLYSLTELERLWIGCLNKVPAEQIAAMREAAPNCEINTEVYEDPTGGRWRYVGYNDKAYLYIYHDRYIQLREQFGDYADSAYSYYWNDPLY